MPRELISPNMSAANSLFEFPIKDGNQVIDIQSNFIKPD